MDNKFIKAGEIVGTHGIKGEMRINVWTDSAEFLKKFKTFYIDGKAVKVESSRVHKSLLLVKLEGVDDINMAMTKKGKIVYISREDVKLPKGTFFLGDIIGATVVDEDDNVLGELVEVMEAPAANIYVVKGEREILIPAVENFVLNTDVENKKIVVRLIEGM